MIASYVCPYLGVQGFHATYRQHEVCGRCSQSASISFSLVKAAVLLTSESKQQQASRDTFYPGIMKELGVEYGLLLKKEERTPRYREREDSGMSQRLSCLPVYSAMRY